MRPTMALFETNRADKYRVQIVGSACPMTLWPNGPMAHGDSGGTASTTLLLALRLMRLRISQRGADPSMDMHNNRN